MIVPLPRDGVQLLRRCDNNGGAPNTPHLRLGSISGELHTLQRHVAELLLPIAGSLRAQGLGWCLVNNFEIFVTALEGQLANSKLENRRLPASRRCGYNDVVISVVNWVETLRLDSIEQIKREHGSEPL